MKKVFLSMLAGAVAVTTANAQEAESAPLTLSGSVDTYYRTTLNTSDKSAGIAVAPGSSYADGTGINIGMVNLAASKEGEKSGFVADVYFGPRGQAGNGASGGSLEPDAVNVNQMYVYYNLTDKFTASLGRWNTYLGYEYISPVGNYNYSTSHLFTNGPFSQTGLKLAYAASDKLTITGALMDNLDNYGDKSQNNMMAGGQVAFSTDKLALYANYLGGNVGDDNIVDSTGAGMLNQFDLTTALTPSDDLTIGLNASYRTIMIDKDATDKEKKEKGFAGIALYAQYSLSDNFSLGLRAERFSSRNGAVAYIPTMNIDKSATQQNNRGAVTGLTLSANYKVGDLRIIPEIRTDIYNKNTTDKDDTTGLTKTADFNGKLVKGISSFSVAAVYAF